MRHWGSNHTLYSPGVALFERVVSVHTKNVILTILFSASMLLLPYTAMADNHTEDVTYKIYGSLFNDLGEEAGSTSVKVDSYESVWSVDGQYEINGLTPGEHVIRAYFMNDGHTVIYRTIYVTADTELDFHQGSNWITGTVHHSTSDTVSIGLVERGEEAPITESRFEFGPHAVHEYCTLVAEWEKESTVTTQYLHMRIEEGSSSFPDINHFEFYHGMNNIYGFITDSQGTPVTGALVSNGVDSSISNTDGFYLLKNLSIDTEQTLTIQQEGNDLLPSVQYQVTSGENWLNLTTVTAVEFPGNVSFVTQTQAVTMGVFQIEWDGSDFTDYFSLYDGIPSDENLVYRGPYTSFEYSPEGPGTYEFRIISHNTNGTNENSPALVMIVLPNPTNDRIWQTGMSWNYFVSHTPDYFHNRTYTAIGSETIPDAFGVDRETFLVRIADDSYSTNEKAFRWIDSENLLPVKTYWVDDPDSSSYFQEGTMGWEFTRAGQSSGLLADSPAESLHFNRTNIIGVPGHPNGYDDTYNTVTVTDDVEITVSGVTYSTKYIQITDVNDGILSWELWYNSTVRNYVKIIDRLPGSHSDNVVYELTGYEIPTTPKFITESGDTTNNTFLIEWAEFNGAERYQLLNNDELLYDGSMTSYEVEKLSDGLHVFKINAVMDEGYIISGTDIEINVDFIPPSPIFNPLSSDNTFAIGLGETIELSWTDVTDHDWYSVIVQDTEGTIQEIFNGTENSVSISELSTGQNRLRVNVMVDGKVSEYSPSIFITIEESVDQTSNEENSMPSLSVFSSLLILLLACVFQTTRRR